MSWGIEGEDFTISGHLEGCPHPVTTAQPQLKIVGGCEVMWVPLNGRHGIGRWFFLDAGDWRWVAEEFGTDWVLQQNGGGKRAWVVSRERRAVEAARRRGLIVRESRYPMLYLSRLLVGADADEKVDYLDGNTLNLRFLNLGTIHRPTHTALLDNLLHPPGLISEG